MKMIQMITINLNVHLMMRITVMTVHLEPIIHQMTAMTAMVPVYVMMVIRMMIMTAV